MDASNRGQKDSSGKRLDGGMCRCSDTRVERELAANQELAANGDEPFASACTFSACRLAAESVCAPVCALARACARVYLHYRPPHPHPRCGVGLLKRERGGGGL